MADSDAYIDPEALQQLQERLGTLTNFAPLMSRIGRLLKTDVQRNFRQSKGPDGTPWARLKTRAGQPLRDTKRLQNSIQFEANADEVVVGTNVKYGPFHQFGGGPISAHTRTITQAFGNRLSSPVSFTVKAHESGVPARPFIGLGALQVSKINRAIDNWMEEQGQ